MFRGGGYRYNQDTGASATTARARLAAQGGAGRPRDPNRNTDMGTGPVIAAQLFCPCPRLAGAGPGPTPPPPEPSTMWARYGQSEVGFQPIYSQTDSSDQCVVCGWWGVNATWYDSSGTVQADISAGPTDNLTHSFQCAYGASGDLSWISDIYDLCGCTVFTVRQNAADSSGMTTVWGSYEQITGGFPVLQVTNGGGGSSVSRSVGLGAGAFITQHNAAGVPQWIADIRCPAGNIVPLDIVCTTDNKIVVYGSFSLRVGIPQIEIYDSTGGGVPNATLNGTNSVNLFVAVFNQDGTFFWCGKIVNASGFSSIRGWNVRVDSSRVWVSGYSSLSNFVRAVQDDAGSIVNIACQNSKPTAFVAVYDLLTGVPSGGLIVRGDGVSNVYTDTGVSIVGPFIAPPYFRSAAMAGVDQFWYAGRYENGTVRFYDATNVASAITLNTVFPTAGAVYLAEVDGATGQHQWALKMEGDTVGLDMCYGIWGDGSGVYSVVKQVSGGLTLYDSGGVAVGGGAYSQVAGVGIRQYVLAAWNSAGGYRWSLRIGGINHDERVVLTTDGSGAPVLFGSFEGAQLEICGVGAGGAVVRTVTRTGVRDQFVAKFSAATGALLWVGALLDTGANLTTWMTGTSAGAMYGVSSYVDGPLAVVDSAGATRFLLPGRAVVESMAVVRWPQGGA